MQLYEGRQMVEKNKQEPSEIYKWKFAIGTTSRVPGTKGLHYLILDIDTKKHPQPLLIKLLAIGAGVRATPTEHGWHIYTNFIVTLADFCTLAEECGADPSWISIGMKRGYFFLADKESVNLEWPVERMLIHRGEKG